mmetsp:Transcript_35660/g.68861  ORF Transcript_35660/g.68861 Transcript_35660/m.68861 type:complete len:551 (+) Transcript_35660:843-2495(+)
MQLLVERPGLVRGFEHVKQLQHLLLVVVVHRSEHGGLRLGDVPVLMGEIRAGVDTLGFHADKSLGHPLKPVIEHDRSVGLSVFLGHVSSLQILPLRRLQLDQASLLGFSNGSIGQESIHQVRVRASLQGKVVGGRSGDGVGPEEGKSSRETDKVGLGGNSCNLEALRGLGHDVRPLLDVLAFAHQRPLHGERPWSLEVSPDIPRTPFFFRCHGLLDLLETRLSHRHHHLLVLVVVGHGDFHVRVVRTLEPSMGHFLQRKRFSGLLQGVLHGLNPLDGRRVGVLIRLVVLVQPLVEEIVAHDDLDHANELGGLEVGHSGDEFVRDVESLWLHRHGSRARISRQGAGARDERARHLLETDVSISEDLRAPLALHVDRHRLVEPYLEGGVPRDLAAVDVVVELMDLHGLHVHVSPIGDEVGRGEPRLQDGGVPHVLHAAVVRVLHADLTVGLPGVLVPGVGPLADEAFQLAAHLAQFLRDSRLLGVGGDLVLQRVPNHQKLLNPAPLTLVLARLRPGGEVAPLHTCMQSLQRGLIVPGACGPLLLGQFRFGRQ